jgi:hypothetical protein
LKYSTTALGPNSAQMYVINKAVGRFRT